MSSKSIVIAIVLGSMLIAGAIYLGALPPQLLGNESVSLPEVYPAEVERELNRHVYGNTDAKITIVEFSDFECPFCAQLHSTLKEIVDSSSGTIAWEYRHLPIASHVHARAAAIAAECVAAHAGNAAFWDVAGKMFLERGSLSAARIADLAQEFGVDAATLTACGKDAAVSAQIDQDVATATSLGAHGTPYSMIVNNAGKSQVVSGALPLAGWKSLLNSF